MVFKEIYNNIRIIDFQLTCYLKPMMAFGAFCSSPIRGVILVSSDNLVVYALSHSLISTINDLITKAAFVYFVMKNALELTIKSKN